MKQDIQKYFIWALSAAIGMKIAYGIGIDGLLTKYLSLPEMLVEILPWVAVAAMGACAGVLLLAALGAENQKSPNRLRAHVFGWSITAAICFVLKFGGDWLIKLVNWKLTWGQADPEVEGSGNAVTGALAGFLNYISEFLDAFIGIFVAFGEAYGLFAGLIFVCLAVAIWSVGRIFSGNDRPGRLEQIFVSKIVSKVAAVPMVLTALGIFVGATLWTVAYSFTSSKLIPKFDVTKLTLSQYERLWGEERWIQSIINLGIYGICSLVFTLVLGFMLAAMLDRKIRFENTFRTIFLYPFALSFIVTGLVWQWILNPEFGLQSVVRSWGWESFTFDPLYNPDIVMFGLLIAGLWQGTGLVMCIMLAGLRGIDEDIWKASRVDGIPMWKTYLYIVIPMLKPVFITALVLITSGIVKLYDLVVAQTSGGPGIASEVPAKYVYDKMFQGQNLGQGLAASTMMLVTVVIILIPWAYLQFGEKKHD